MCIDYGDEVLLVQFEKIFIWQCIEFFEIDYYQFMYDMVVQCCWLNIDGYSLEKIEFGNCFDEFFGLFGGCQIVVDEVDFVLE